MEVTIQFAPILFGVSVLTVSVHAPNDDSIVLFSGICGSAHAEGPYTFKDDPDPDILFPGYPCPAPGTIAPGELTPNTGATFSEAFSDSPGDGTWRIAFSVSPPDAQEPAGTVVSRAEIKLTYIPVGPD